MPTPSPIIVAIVSATIGIVDEGDEERDEREPAPRPNERGADRQAHRDDGAEREQQDDHRGEEADDLAVPPSAGRSVTVGELAAELDLHAGFAAPAAVASFSLSYVGRAELERGSS